MVHQSYCSSMVVTEEVLETSPGVLVTVWELQALKKGSEVSAFGNQLIT
jgi:hypothetical protein